MAEIVRRSNADYAFPSQFERVGARDETHILRDEQGLAATPMNREHALREVTDEVRAIVDVARVLAPWLEAGGVSSAAYGALVYQYPHHDDTLEGGLAIKDRTITGISLGVHDVDTHGPISQRQGYFLTEDTIYQFVQHQRPNTPASTHCSPIVPENGQWDNNRITAATDALSQIQPLLAQVVTEYEAARPAYQPV